MPYMVVTQTAAIGVGGAAYMNDPATTGNPSEHESLTAYLNQRESEGWTLISATDNHLFLHKPEESKRSGTAHFI